jgi:signal transduction histidine kinase/ActR/RegA family two-component response regulator
MSVHGDKAAWGELLAGPPLDREVRAALAERIMGWVLVPLWLLSLVTTTAIILTSGWSAPTRLVPSAISVLSLLYLHRLTRKERWVDAAAALSALMFVAIASGVLLNGVDAPVYAAGMILLVLVVPMFGARAGMFTLGALLLLGLAAVGLEQADLRLPVTPVTSLVRVVLYSSYGLFGLAMLAKTAQLLAAALHTAESARAGEAATDLAFHAVFDQATTGMLLLTAAGTIAQINTNAARLLGEPEHALVGRSLDAAELWSSGQRDELRAAVTAAAGGSSQQQELTLGQSVYQLRLSPFYDQAGKLGHVLVELSDLTDLIATRTLLAEARRMEALGKLSGGIAHDINNMLAAVSGGSELARQGHEAANQEEVQSGLEVVDTSVRRAAALIRQLLAFGSRDRIASVDIDLNRLVRDMGKLFARTLQRQISIDIRTSDEPVWVRGDSAALENVLLNLALNAQDAMPEGGRLIFEVSARTLSDDDCAQLKQEIEPGPAASLCVSDTGTGMSLEVRERIFEPFFTTKASGHGTGLGLSAVHGTIRNHHGAIIVHSRIGYGSSFELLLPATRPVAREPDAPVHSVVAPRSLRASVLLAEDEPLVRSIIVKMLTHAGCEVHAVNDGQTLLRELGSGFLPDVIITDLMMPGISGARLLSAIDAILPGCPLILMTGFTGDDISALLAGRGRHQLLRKPFAQAQLMRALEELLSEATPQQTVSA